MALKQQILKSTFVVKFSNILILIFLFSFIKLIAQAPLAGCWHPDFVKDWTPEKDPDRKFNRATVPLQPRIPVATTVKAHNQQFPEGQIAACLAMHPSANLVPSQGAYNFIGYNPNYWQYMDVLVWWGGSAAEGIILPPSAPVIDAAHLSGVKVLGQIFFPPTAFGGVPAWTTEMNSTTGNGVYPYARKLAEIAKYYGFDGWFINSETVISTSWTGWTRDYLRYAKEIGLEGQEIQLYDMSISVTSERSTGVARQIGGSFMVNYGGTNNTIAATANHTNEAEWGNKFESWYSGQEQSTSITENGVNVKNIFTTTGHVASVNFFNPEEKIWKSVVRNLLNTANASGTTAHNAMKTVFENEKVFWTNATGNVTSQDRGEASVMPGLATMIQERSAIQSKPFISTFSAGQGKHWFVNGELKGTQDWYHRGMQTVMPTWRWWALKGADFASELQFNLNWDDAYNIGSSVDISGSLTNLTDYVINLYKTKIAIEAGDRVELVYKTNATGSLKLRLGTEATTAVTTTFNPVSRVVRNGWIVDTYDLTPLAGKELRMISLNLNPAFYGASYLARLGQIAVYPAGYAPSSASVGNLEIQNELGATRGDLRVVWDHPADISQLHHYNIYLTRNGVTRLAGQTRNEGYYIPPFTRSGLNENEVTVQVVPVYKNMEEATALAVLATATFPQAELPQVNLLVSKSSIAPGEEVTFTAEATQYPQQYNWEEPEAGKGTTVRQTGATAVYKFNTEGKHDVKVSVTNAVGTTTRVQRGIVNVQTSTLIPVSRAANGGSVSGSFNGYDTNGFVTANGQHPGWLIDDTTVPASLNEKWCVGGEKEHWVTVTLDKVYELYRFVIFDGGHKESAGDNMTHYRIFTSVDKVNWELVLDRQNVPATGANNTKDHYVAPVFAKYVRLIPYNPAKTITVRLWQFDVYGKEAVPAPVLAKLKADKRLVRTNEELTLSVEGLLNPQSFEWQLPFANKVSQQDNATGSQAVVKFDQEGSYDVTVLASNAGGSGYAEAKGLIKVSNTEELISVNKPVVLTNAGELSVRYLTDGVTDPVFVDYRWSVSGAAEYWAIIDLQDSYDITRFAVYDSGNLRQSPVNSVNHYNIYVASTVDAAGNGDWQPVVRGRNAVLEKVKEDVLAEPVRARYVKFSPYDWSIFSAKVYEFEVYGKAKVSSLSNPVDAATLVVWPNPVNRGVDLQVEARGVGNIRILSVDGRLVQQFTADQPVVSVSTSGLEPGIYLLEVQGEQCRIVKLAVK